MMQEFSPQDTYAEYQLKNVKMRLAAYAPKPGEPSGTFMGVSVANLDRDDLIALVGFLIVTSHAQLTERYERLDKLDSLRPGR